jgi:hypothetical protein
MDTTQNSRNRQYVDSPPETTRHVSLSSADRRLLLTSTLCLLLKRSRHGFQVTADDLLRLIPYTEPGAATAIESAAA